MTDDYRYRCAACARIQPVPTDGEDSVRLGCDNCGNVRNHERIWTCVECGTNTTSPYWPRDVASADDGPLCPTDYGKLVINHQ